MKPQPKIFLDLDGVIVYMQIPLMQLWRVNIDHDHEYPPSFLWDIQGAIDHLRIQQGLEPTNVPAKDFWHNMNEDWWLGLQPYVGFREFVAALENRGEVTLATAHVSPHCAAAKYKWIERWMPDYVRNAFVGDPKHMLAEPNSILIDDRDKNCETFIKRGGKAILVPRPWNLRGYYAGPVYPLVLDQLDTINRKVTWT